MPLCVILQQVVIDLWSLLAYLPSEGPEWDALCSLWILTTPQLCSNLTVCGCRQLSAGLLCALHRKIAWIGPHKAEWCTESICHSCAIGPIAIILQSLIQSATWLPELWIRISSSQTYATHDRALPFPGTICSSADPLLVASVSNMIVFKEFWQWLLQSGREGVTPGLLGTSELLGP
jgi:hypothetical protein